MLLHPEVELDHQSPIGRGMHVACAGQKFNSESSTGRCTALQPVQPLAHERPWGVDGARGPLGNVGRGAGAKC